MKQYVLSFVFFLVPFILQAQNDYIISEAIDLPEWGLNKVLHMRNGNTLVFHFENRKSIRVNVFDSTLKEIAGEKHITKIIDINAFDRTYFDQLFDINGEAVMFLTQDVDNKETTVRLRFNAENGKLISEDKLFQSPTFTKRFHTFLDRQKGKDDYVMIGYHRDKATEADVDIKVYKYNSAHAVTNEYSVTPDNSKYDYIRFLNFEIDATGGILLVFNLSKIVQYPAINDEFLLLHYLPPGQDAFISKVIELPKGIREIGATIQYNEATKLHTVFLKDIARTYYSEKDQRIAAKYYYSLVVADGQMNLQKLKPLNNNKLDEFLQSNVNKSYNFNGILQDMKTDKNGITTVAYQERHLLVEPAKKEKVTRCNIAVARYDINGKESWATILPRSSLRYVKGTYPDIMYHNCESDFITFASYTSKDNKYHILFNDLDAHFNLPMDAHTDSLYRHQSLFYSYDLTNGVHYIIDEDNQVKKEYLFGKPEEGEYRHIYTLAGNYNEETGDYVTLLMKKIDKKNTIHLAKRKL